MGSDEENLLELMSEHRTRKKLIDPELVKRQWNSRYIKEEVNVKKTDFKNGDYVLFDGKVEKGEVYIDYVLLSQNNLPLAIIESKRYSKDAEKGRIQARTYIEEIEKQTRKKVPIFLTNGDVWKLIDHAGERKISGPFSQNDLKRRNDLGETQKDPRTVQIDTNIIDRPKSVYIAKKLAEHFSTGRRKALVVMATGTGKTRVAMALIKMMIDANMVRTVLFLADRIELVDQAKSSGFIEFFTEPVADIREGVTTNSRLYVSTIQTLIANGTYKEFSPGFFDLVVFDEAHRSYYDKQGIIPSYFDAIKIGLTATPRGDIGHDTYDLFECENDEPTVEYPYMEAVRDEVLVPYCAEIIETEVLSLGIRGSKLSNELQDEIRRQEENPETLELHGGEFDRVFMDDKTNRLIIQEFMTLCYKSDEGKPCKTIFFCASMKHADRIKEIFNQMFPSLSSDVQVITSDYYRAQDEIKRFKKYSEPRIALSVGMLDTGVDIPEVCNLVFIKPVFSSVRFWQMLGRGTRNRKACKHPEWLPNRDKKDFLILDFAIGGHSNIKHHQLEANNERGQKKGAQTRIFENRVSLLGENLTEEQKIIVTRMVIDSMDMLCEDDFYIREKRPVIEKIRQNKFNLEQYITELNDEITPLMMFVPGTDPNITSFVLTAERLFKNILKRDRENIDKIRENIQKKVANLLQQTNLMAIQQKKTELVKILQPKFWDNLTFADVEFMVKEIAPLMKYYEPDKNRVLQVDAPDIILSREEFEMEIKEDPKLLEFIENNPLMQKIKNGGHITSKELKQIEQDLSSLRPEITIENIQVHKQKDFLVFLKELLGQADEENPRRQIEQRFDEHIIDTKDYNPRQIEFLLLLKKVFAERKYVEKPDFANEPLGEEHPLDIFSMEQIETIITECGEIQVL